MKKSFCLWMAALTVGLMLTGMSADAAKPKQNNEEVKRVKLFEAMDAGLVEVQMKSKDANECEITFKNKTKQPLRIDLPSAFASVPVVKQDFGFADDFGGGMGGMGGMDGMDSGNRRGGRDSGMGGSSSSGGGNQSMGGGFGNNSSMGGMGGGGWGGGGGGWGNSFFNVPAEKSIRHKARTVCLEHGKNDPSPNVKYKMVPIDEYTSNKTTQLLCSLLANPEVDREAIQAAAWNQENKMTFDELSAKTTKLRPDAAPTPYFNRQQLAAAQQVLAMAQKNIARQVEVEAKLKALEDVDQPSKAENTDKSSEK